jgi:hypothetical protein
VRLTFPAIIALAALAAAGCTECPKSFVSIDRLVGDYNANARRVPRLWARAKIAVRLADERGWSLTWGSTSPLATPNGLLLLFKGEPPGPHDFVLIGREVAGVEVFRAGSKRQQQMPGLPAPEDVYYFWYDLAGRGGAWWGLHKLAGAPGTAKLPINPNDLLAVLGVCELPSDLTALPGAALTLSRDPCAYVLTCFDRQPGTRRIRFRREVLFHWSDDLPRRPYQVNFIDAHGRRVMTAELKRYRPIAQEEGAPGPAPVMPTDILIKPVPWATGSDGRPAPHNPLRSIHIVLSHMTTEPKGSPEACAFDPPGGRAVRIDRGADAGGAPGEGP